MTKTSNKLAIITGSNSGIGRETALGLVKQNFDVILACRNQKKGDQAKEYILKASNNSHVSVEQLDLADLYSVKEFSERIKNQYNSIDVLINNAGSVFNYLDFTKDGIEQTFGINHLGHFYLTRLLLRQIVEAAPSRIINISSFAHYNANGIQLDDINYEKTPYKGFRAYSQSKLANIYFTKYLASLLDRDTTTVNAVHPGAVRSGFGMDGDLRGLYGLSNKVFRIFEISSTAGAKTPIWLATSQKGAEATGEYFARKKPGLLSAKARSFENAEELWNFSEKLIRDRGFDLPPIKF